MIWWEALVTISAVVVSFFLGRWSAQHDPYDVDPDEEEWWQL